MEIITTSEGWEFLFRWFHFLAGTTWIGVLYYFNFIQTPFFGSELGGEAKSAMTRGLVPNALWWFRWGAMFTFITGWTMILMYLGHGIDLGMPLMTKILTGGAMGTIMWANVWFVIWPAQQVVIKSAEQIAAGGEAIPTAAAGAARAGLASRTNTMFSIPMLFFMGSARHLSSFHNGENDAMYWIVALVIIGLLELNCLIGTGQGRQKYLGSVSGTIHAGIAATVVLYIVGVVLNG
ncbi:MAG: urate hydroxylase PuuD [Deltaproteobacteria bacterium]|nr:urate hydroxylase PuuD [Deltaproteobacteria bacterium]MBW2393949.1 urate hydroxylase PuuD [Deltaproteobacteria bacterium]